MGEGGGGCRRGWFGGRDAMGREWGLVGEEGAIHTGGWNEETVLGENDDMVAWSGSCETLLPALVCFVKLVLSDNASAANFFLEKS